ncbi:hypothetical protein LG329_05655 [Virgibacillus necropolis]
MRNLGKEYPDLQKEDARRRSRKGQKLFDMFEFIFELAGLIVRIFIK